MLEVAGNCNEVVTQNVEKSLLKGKRDREFGSVSSSEQETFLSERRNLHDYLEKKLGELFMVNAWL